MKCINLTNPDKSPLNGDKIKFVKTNGGWFIKTFKDKEPAHQCIKDKIKKDIDVKAKEVDVLSVIIPSALK